LFSLATTATPTGGLFALYAKVQGLGPPLWWGALVWNTTESRFDELSRWNTSVAPFLQDGVLGAQATVGVDGYIYFTSAYPQYRVPAHPASFAALPTTYEGWSCLENGTTVADNRVERGSSGKPVWQWRLATEAPSEDDEKHKLNLWPAGRWLSLNNGTVQLQRGSTHWNDALGRFVLVGSADPGTVWVAAADKGAPIEGPYRTAVLVAAHNSTGSTLSPQGSITSRATNLYNPTQHPFLTDPLSSPTTIFFSGTYCTSFAPQEHKTPLYDYNSLMYRVDLGPLFLK
jgi:hypothetical protein